jgi:hypothetical protein
LRRRERVDVAVDRHSDAASARARASA